MAKKSPAPPPAAAPGPFTPPPVAAVDAVPEGKVVDFLTGKHVQDTPEEYVRQNIEKALVREYKYAPADCTPEFRIYMGSAKPRVDIAVFPPGQPHTQANAAVLVETKRAGTKRDDKDDGTGGLLSYLAAGPNARYGMWTNGDDRVCYARRESGGQTVFVEVPDIPAAGQTEADAARPRHKDLTPATADNLLFAFRRCHNYIAGTEGKQNSRRPTPSGSC